MKENNLEFTTIEVKGFQDLCQRLADLEAENEFLKRQNTALKMRCRTQSKEIMDLEDKLANVTLWDLSPKAQEEAGHMLARSLLGGK